MPNVVAIRRPGEFYRGLTPCEREVIELAHLPNADIASILGKRRATVKAQMRSAFQKLGAENRTAAALILQRLERTAA